MWVAAAGSVVISWAGLFSVGGIIFLIACLQIASTVALQRGADRHEWKVLLLLAVLIWIVVVPIQILMLVTFGWFFLGWFYLFPFLGVVGLLIPLLPAAYAKTRLIWR